MERNFVQAFLGKGMAEIRGHRTRWRYAGTDYPGIRQPNPNPFSCWMKLIRCHRFPGDPLQPCWRCPIGQNNSGDHYQDAIFHRLCLSLPITALIFLNRSWIVWRLFIYRDIRKRKKSDCPAASYSKQLEENGYERNLRISKAPCGILENIPGRPACVIGGR